MKKVIVLFLALCFACSACPSYPAETQMSNTYSEHWLDWTDRYFTRPAAFQSPRRNTTETTMETITYPTEEPTLNLTGNNSTD